MFSFFSGEMSNYGTHRSKRHNLRGFPMPAITPCDPRSPSCTFSLPWIPHPITTDALAPLAPPATHQARITPNGKIIDIIPVKNIHKQNIIQKLFPTISILFSSDLKSALCFDKECGQTCGVSPFGLRYCVGRPNELRCVLQPVPPTCAGKYIQDKAD